MKKSFKDISYLSCSPRRKDRMPRDQRRYKPHLSTRSRAGRLDLRGDGASALNPPTRTLERL